MERPLKGLTLTLHIEEPVNLYRDGELLGRVAVVRDPAHVHQPKCRVKFEFPRDVSIIRAEVDTRGGTP